MLKPLSLGGSYRPDTEFDSTLRVPVRPSRIRVGAVPRLGSPGRIPETTLPGPALGVSVVPGSRAISFAPPPHGHDPEIPAQPPAQPVVQPPPVPVPQPPATPTSPPPVGPQSLPTNYDPGQLNFEGSTYNPGISPTATTTSYAPNEQAVSDALASLEKFSGLKIDPKWRDRLRADPKAFLSYLSNLVAGWQKTGNPGHNITPDTSFRQRLSDWLAGVSAAITQTSTGPNPDYQRMFLGQTAYNQGLERLKQENAYTSRDDEEQLLALLSSRGLLNSGIASRELARLQASRSRNFYNQAAELNQTLLRAELGYVTEKDLATIRAQLERGNQEYLMRLKDKLDRSGNPNAWAQILGAIVGTGAGFLTGGPAGAALGLGSSIASPGAGTGASLDPTEFLYT